MDIFDGFYVPNFMLANVLRNYVEVMKCRGQIVAKEEQFGIS